VLSLMYVEFFNVYLHSRRWFMLCLVSISYVNVFTFDVRL
jgi:hypothetical protein